MTLSRLDMAGGGGGEGGGGGGGGGWGWRCRMPLGEPDGLI